MAFWGCMYYIKIFLAHVACDLQAFEAFCISKMTKHRDTAELFITQTDM